MKLIKFIVSAVLVLVVVIAFASCGGCSFLSGCSDITNTVKGIFS